MKFLLHKSASLFFVLFMLGSAFASPFDPQSFDKPVEIPLDYSFFKSDEPGGIRLEVYYQVYNRMFAFEEVGNKFEAKYEVQLVINDNDGHQVGYDHKQRSILVETEAEANSGFNYRTNQANFELEPGKYKIQLNISELNSGRIFRAEAQVKIKSFKKKKKPTLSGIEFIDKAGRSGETKSIFDKSDFTVVPSVGNVFGGEDDPRLLFYIEAYPGKEDSQTVMVTAIRSRIRGLVYRDSLHISIDQPVVRQIRNISLDGFYSGEYELSVELRGRKDKKLCGVNRNFKVRWSLQSTLRNDYKKALDQLTLIANRNEVDSLKKYEKYEDRVAAFDRFWRRLDSSPETVENEVKKSFYYRISTANRLFSYLYREGWSTDRGRVFVKFGEPDQLDDFPIVHNSRPYQVWHYYNQGRYRRFTFVDENEDGDYRLQYPYDGLGLTPDF